MNRGDGIKEAKSLLSVYEKKHGLKITKSRILKECESIVIVLTTTNDHKTAIKYVWKTHLGDNKSWVVFFPKEDNMNCLWNIDVINEINRILRSNLGERAKNDIEIVDKKLESTDKKFTLKKVLEI
jgi:hypothetical protein